MSDECRQIESWLTDGTQHGNLPCGVPETPLEVTLRVHATGCETCRRRLTIDADLRERLGDGATLDPARRAALVARLGAAAVPVARPWRQGWRWAWVPVAAAAALVLAAVLFWPAAPCNPISPTQVLGDLLGPFAEPSFFAGETEPAAPTPVETATPPAGDPLALGDVLGAFWGDLAGPVSVGLEALEAPRAAAAPATAPATAPAATADKAVEKP
jgi:hypothetical protein